MKISLVASIMALSVNAQSVLACTTILVGSQATVDGSSIIARNYDTSSALLSPVMFRHSAKLSPINFVSNPVRNITHRLFSTTLPPDTLGYTAFPQITTFNTTNLSCEETGINDFGITISATELISNSPNVLIVDPYTDGGITADAITTVILRQATSARHGIALLGGYIEFNGAGEGFGVTLGDFNETWYLETASGHHWVAQRLPEDSYFVSANQGRFQTIDFNDAMSVMSSDIIPFLEKLHLYDPASVPLNLFNCCMANGARDVTYNNPRVLRLQSFYSDPSDASQNGLSVVFPKPARKLSVRDVATGLRDHFNGTSNDPYQNQNPEEPLRPISVMRTSFSHITQHFHGRPPGIDTVQYIALGMADLSAYIPLYSGLPSIPEQYKTKTLTADDQSLFWKTRKMQALVFLNYPAFAPSVKAKLEQFETETAVLQEKLVEKYLATWFSSSSQATELIQDFTTDILSRYDQLLDSIIKDLAQKAHRSAITDAEYTALIDSIEKRYHFDSQ